MRFGTTRNVLRCTREEGAVIVTAQGCMCVKNVETYNETRR